MMKATSTSKALPAKVGDGKSSGLGYGCMGITAFYGDPMRDEDSFELLKSVYDLGVRHFDTAEIYKSGNFMADALGDKYNEIALGNFIKTVPRDSYTVATKYMPQKHESKNDYETVKGALLASLEKLGLEYVDLYYCHRMTSLEGAMEFAASAKRLKEEGLIQAIGLSEIRGSWLKKVYTEVCPINAVQQEWSLMTRNLEDELIPVCKELGVVIVAYSPLYRNFLTSVSGSAPTDWRGTLPRYQGEAFDKNLQLMKEVMLPLADKFSCSLAQLSLAWLFHRAEEMGVVVIPIPGSTKITNVTSNKGSTEIEINVEDMKALNSMADKVVGERGGKDYTSGGIENQADP